MTRLALLLAAAGTLLTLNLQFPWLRVERSSGETAVEGKLALVEHLCAERPPETVFLLLKEQPCEGMGGDVGTKVFLVSADTEFGFGDLIRYENIPKSAIKATESLLEITLPTDFDLKNTIFALEINPKVRIFPISSSPACLFPCLSSRRLDYDYYSSDSPKDSDSCDEDSDPDSSCKSISLPTWVSVLITLALCLG